MAARANVLRDVLMIRDGLFEFSSDLFQYSDLDDFVKSLAEVDFLSFMLNCSLFS